MKYLVLLADVSGKLWSFPNTLIGLVYGGSGLLIGKILCSLSLSSVRSSIKFGNNALQFLNNPLTIPCSAITLGNTISYGKGVSPSDYGAYGDISVQIGLHEQAHTYQFQILGPLFIPVYFIVGGFAGPKRNPLEKAAQNFGRGTGKWWPW